MNIRKGQKQKGGKAIIPKKKKDEKQAEKPATFEDLFNSYYPQVVRHLTYLLGDRMAAEDIAQETFFKFHSSPPLSQDNPGGWLRMVSQRLALNWLRGKKRREVRELQAAMLEHNQVVPLEEAVLRTEEVRRIRQALAPLPERDRLALLLRHSGTKYAEIAELLQVPVSSVGTILARAQHKFMQIYDEGKEE